MAISKGAVNARR